MQTPSQVSSSASTPAPASAKQRGWWGRNWKRLLLTVVVLAILAAGGGYLYKFGPILFSTPYHQAMADLRQSPEVKKMLGEPIRDGWFPAGSVNNDEGEARVYLDVHGPKTADGREPMAHVSIQARSLDGKWDFTQFDVQPEGGQRVNLIDEISAGEVSDVPLFNSKQPPAPKAEVAPPPDVNIQIPDLPSDTPKK